METELVEGLNRMIGGEYVTIDGHKIFRLVWSEEIFENRHGTFREFTESGLFIREVTETRRVRKYNYIHNRWIFEMWAPGNLTKNRETPDADSGDYVPVYVFESRDGNYLPPNEKVVRFLISALQGKVKHDEIPSREYLEEKEISKQMEIMEDHPAWFQTRAGVARNAIWYAGGIPEWDRRRADVLNERAINMVEQHAIQEARIKAKEMEEKREHELAMKREEMRTIVRAAEEKREQKEEKLKRREHAKEVLEKTPDISKSPMHRGQ